MSRGTLVVVDMQEGFAAAHCRETRNCVRREIEQAMEKRWSIVILEVEPKENERTFAELLAPLKQVEYKHWVVKHKYSNSGAGQVLETIKDPQLCFPADVVRVCGVNIQACVSATVLWLAILLPSDSVIEVVQDACNSDLDGGWRLFPTGRRIYFLPYGDRGERRKTPLLPSE